MIPPLLGFYAKYLIISNISRVNIGIAILIIIASVISCVKYLSIIQISNFMAPIISSGVSKIKVSISDSYIISTLTIFILLGILKPIYLLNIITYLNI